MPSLKEFLFGKEQKIKQLPTQSPQQQQLLNSILSLLQGGAGGGGAEGGINLLMQYLDPQSDVYKNFEAPYMQQFEQETIPMLAEKFAGLGGGMGGGLSSSGFGQSLGAAGSNLQTQLAALKSGMQKQSLSDLLGLTQNVLGVSPFAYLQKQASPGFWAQAAGAALKSGAAGL